VATDRRPTAAREGERAGGLQGSPTTIRPLEAITDPNGQKYDFNNHPAVPPAGQSSSVEKFIAFDKNFAHLWFYHEIVGIKYFSTTFFHTVKRYVKDPTCRKRAPSRAMIRRIGRSRTSAPSSRTIACGATTLWDFGPRRDSWERWVSRNR